MCDRRVQHVASMVLVLPHVRPSGWLHFILSKENPRIRGASGFAGLSPDLHLLPPSTPETCQLEEQTEQGLCPRLGGLCVSDVTATSQSQGWSRTLVPVQAHSPLPCDQALARP